MRFRGTVESAGGGGAFVRLPFDPRQAFGKARAPVRGSVNGAPFRSTVAIYGGAAFLGLPKSLRAAAAADVGDEVQVEIERDEEPREVEVPPELAAALRGDAQATEAFNELSYTHRREYARWVGEAKRPETRNRRARRALELLRGGIVTPDDSSRTAARASTSSVEGRARRRSPSA